MSELDEPVSLSDYQPSWPMAFLSERQRIVAGLGVASPFVEHIGSTAVPGLSAKPVIDLMLGLQVLPPPASFMATIERLGYESLGEAGVPGRLYFRRREAIQSNLHVVRHEGGHWVSNLALRNYLRTSASARERYTEAKRRALADGATSLLSYSAAKASTISALLREANASAG